MQRHLVTSTPPTAPTQPVDAGALPVRIEEAADGDYLALPSVRRARLLVPRQPTARKHFRRLEPGTSLKSSAFRLGLTVPGAMGVRARVQGAEHLTEMISGSLGRPVRLAFRLGTPGAYTKLGILVMDSEGTALAFGKAAAALATGQVLREAEALRQLANDGGLQGAIPSVLALVSSDAVTLLLLSLAPSRPGPRSWDTRHDAFANRLIGSTHHPATIDSSTLWSNAVATVAELETWLTEPWRERLQNAMEQVATADTRVKLGYAHRDLAPWNTSLDEEGGLFVFDWEFAEDGYPLGYDSLHFAASLAARRNGGRARVAWDRRAAATGRDICMAYLVDMSLLYLRARHDAPSVGNEDFLRWLGQELDLLLGVQR